MFHRDRKAPTREIKGNLIQLALALHLQAGILQNHHSERTFHAHLVNAVEIGQQADALRWLAQRVTYPVEGQIAAGQCAGFVAA